MLKDTLDQIIAEVQNTKAEGQTLEVKSARGGAPDVTDTLSSFSNQADGGIILFGIDEKRNFEICGVYDAHLLLKKIMEQAEKMEPIVRIEFTDTEINGKTIVSAEIPGVEYGKRPVHIRAKGPYSSSYIRVGDADKKMTEYEVSDYEMFKRGIRSDIREIPESDIHFINQERYELYIRNLKKDNPVFTQNVRDDNILQFMNLAKGDHFTISGLMLFSPYPQNVKPLLSIHAALINGTEKGEVSDNGERFADSKVIRGAIPEMLEGAMNFIRKNSRKAIVIDQDGKRINRDEYPMPAVREALLNALIHRDYSELADSTAIELEMYSDRLEIRNRGALFGNMSIEDLGKVQTERRNPTLVSAMEMLDQTENRQSGILSIRNQMKKAGLPEPEFYSSRGEFKVVFRNNREDIKAQENEKTGGEIPRILQFCKEPKSRKEISEFLSLTPAYAMKKYIRPLLEQGKLKMTIPESPKSRNQKYYSA